MRRVKSEFSNIAGFPGVIGCVDGSLVRLIKPSPDQERGFINRKGFPSINVMAVCDAKENSHLSMRSGMDQLTIALYSEYPHLDATWRETTGVWKMGLFLETAELQIPTKRQTSIGGSAEQGNLLSVRYDVGRGDLEFSMERKTPAKASEVIVACAALHNIAIMLQEPDVPDADNDDGADAQIPYTGRETGFLVRDHLAQVYF
ncbi:putative nuclease HARBI1 [Mya arenaria]|uniref:putative nuclease HARBI1 n=1 Tax=Mya arenaria TaxID=6604 RepID=UPI0022E65B02|nr:putative nuclease HARBI1 [Mya arenaria]